ncbi:MAG: sensor histidine kinase [Acidobacteriia bacterium]|nr:sensor histidine kinase [Terriglobia bacterium]
MTRLFTPAGRRHIGRLLQALAGDSDRVERRFQALLRKRGHTAAAIRALLAVTPAACARVGSLSRFLEQVDYHGRRLAKLNVPLPAVLDALEQAWELVDGVLEGRFAPAREQLYLATRLALDHGFYQVREAESQAFFGLYRAEVEAENPDDLLRRMVGVLAQAFGASGGWMLLLEGGLPPKLAQPMYVECAGSGGRRTANAAPLGRYGSYWSYPFGPSAVLQLGFRGPYPWLPREQVLLAAAAARCQEALERVRMQADIRRLEAEARHAEQEERRRIGRELHDEAGQSMMLLRLQLEMMERGAPENLRPRLAEARELAGRTAVELRRIVAALSPAVLERLGLQTALRQLVGRFRKVHGARVRLRSEGLREGLPRQTEEVIYRVTQEGLHNIAKHTQATCVNLCLRAADKRIRLSVADNGAGFRTDRAGSKPKSFGLAGMRERVALLGGTLAVQSAPGKGTRVTLELPLTAAPVEIHGKDSRSFD